MLSKTANSAYNEYRKSGGTLAFTEFLDREKQKLMSANGQQDSLFLVNRDLNDSVQNAIRETLQKGGYKTNESGKTIFGINKFVLIGAVTLLIGTMTVVIYKKLKK